MRTKSRLTITLPEDVLNQVDSFIDGKQIRNRSHAIETLILKSLMPSVKTAVILAGGKGSVNGPPPLQKIFGKFLLAHQLEHLKNFGLANVVICGGSDSEKILQVFGDGSEFGVEIVYVDEKKPMGTAGAIKLAEKYLDSNPFLVMHGDVLTDLNLSEFIDFHLEENTLATLGVKPRMGEKEYGQVFMQGNKIIKFMENGATEGISIVNTGIYVFKPKVLDIIPAGKKLKLESAIFPALASERQLSAFIFQGVWRDVSMG